MELKPWAYLAALDVHRMKLLDDVSQRAASHRSPDPNMILVHGPTHASWLNQKEVYFSVLRHKALTPNNFGSLTGLAERILGLQSHTSKRSNHSNGNSPGETSLDSSGKPTASSPIL